MDGQERYRRCRRRAAWRILVVLLVGLAVQIGGWAAAAGLPALEGTVLVGAMAAQYVAVGLLAPRPPGGFAWPSSLRRRNGKSRTPVSFDAGFDLLGAVAILVGLLPWQLVNTWLQERGLHFGVHLAVLLAVVVSGNALMSGTIALRRRRDRGAASSSSAPAPASD